MPGQAPRRALRIQIVEIVQVIDPQLLGTGWPPVVRRHAAALHVEQTKGLRCDEGRRRGNRRGIRRGAWPRRRRLTQVGFRPEEPQTDSCGHLSGPQVSDRVKIATQ